MNLGNNSKNVSSIRDDPQKVLIFLINLDENKGSGPDGILSLFLKNMCKFTTTPFI